MRRSMVVFIVAGLAAIGCGAPFEGGSGSTGTGGGSGTTTASGASTGGNTTTTGAGGAQSSSSASAGGAPSTSSASGSGGGGVDAGPLGPTVKIAHPGAEDRQKGVPIYFHAVVTDPTDVTLTGSALVWTDSQEGKFGTGNDFMWAPTMLGEHTITLQGTDSLGYSATDAITLKVIP